MIDELVFYVDIASRRLKHYLKYTNSMQMCQGDAIIISLDFLLNVCDLFFSNISLCIRIQDIFPCVKLSV